MQAVPDDDAQDDAFFATASQVGANHGGRGQASSGQKSAAGDEWQQRWSHLREKQKRAKTQARALQLIAAVVVAGAAVCGLLAIRRNLHGSVLPREYQHVPLSPEAESPRERQRGRLRFPRSHDRPPSPPKAMSPDAPPGTGTGERTVRRRSSASLGV